MALTLAIRPGAETLVATPDNFMLTALSLQQAVELMGQGWER